MKSQLLPKLLRLATDAQVLSVRGNQTLRNEFALFAGKSELTRLHRQAYTESGALDDRRASVACIA